MIRNPAFAVRQRALMGGSSQYAKVESVMIIKDVSMVFTVTLENCAKIRADNRESSPYLQSAIWAGVLPAKSKWDVFIATPTS